MPRGLGFPIRQIENREAPGPDISILQREIPALAKRQLCTQKGVLIGLI